MKKTICKMVSVLLLTVIALGILGACGTNQSVVGTWEFVNIGATFGYNTRTFSLYEDGRCVGSPISCPGGTEAVSYVLESDGTLIFSDQWNGQKVVPRTNDIELAVSDPSYYYLSGDTMVIYTCTYKRQ